MAKASRSSAIRCFRRAGTIVGACWLFYFLPPFHVVPMRGPGQPTAGTAEFDASAYVEKLWNEQLVHSEDRAVDADVLITALRNHAEEAARRYGHRLGVSRTSCYLVRGTGRVISVKDDVVSIALGEGGAEADVVIEMGPVFGNAVRDGSDLLDVNQFPNSQHFNALAAELNRRVEERVFPQLKKVARPGVTLRFLGCAEVTNPETDTRPLRLVPIRIESP